MSTTSEEGRYPSSDEEAVSCGHDFDPDVECKECGQRMLDALTAIANRCDYAIDEHERPIITRQTPKEAFAFVTACEAIGRDPYEMRGL